MLHKYQFKNFFSFAETTEVSFELSNQAPNSDLMFQSPGGTRLSKVLAIIGPNASGKTNALKPLSFLNWFIVRSFTTYKPEGNFRLQPHYFLGSDHSEFEIEFEVSGQHYRYHLIVTQERVEQESLYLKTSQLFSYIFRRKWSESDSTYQIRQQKFGFAAREAKKVRPNASLIATAAQYNVPCALELVDYFERFYTNVTYSGRGHFDSGDVFSTARYFHDHPAMRGQMSDILSRLDLGLAKVIIKSGEFVDKESGEREKMNVPLGVHRKGKHEHELPLWYESSGTQAAFVLLEKILPALEYGGIVIIDELEANLHPDIIVAMLDLFLDRERNPHNAQIIFTCHALEILNELQKDQVLLIEKDADGNSEAWRLSDMKGIRRDINLYAKYRAGKYGAIPDL